MIKEPIKKFLLSLGFVTAQEMYEQITLVHTNSTKFATKAVREFREEVLEMAADMSTSMADQCNRDFILLNKQVDQKIENTREDIRVKQELLNQTVAAHSETLTDVLATSAPGSYCSVCRALVARFTLKKDGSVVCANCENK